MRLPVREVERDKNQGHTLRELPRFRKMEEEQPEKVSGSETRNLRTVQEEGSRENTYGRETSELQTL